MTVATVVAVMDRDGWGARTDNIVVADRKRRRLLWVPRDLWCPVLGDRINEAFARGGFAAFRAALGEHGIRVDGGVFLARAATERALASVAVTVPVPRRLVYWYPLTPVSPLEEGRTLVSFEPPEERLSGERIHQWIGARTTVEGLGSDLERIERQKILVRALLESGFDFSGAVADPELALFFGAEPGDEIATVTAGWRFDTLEGLAPARLAGKSVLVRRRRPTARGLWRDWVVNPAERGRWEPRRRSTWQRYAGALYRVAGLGKSAVLRWSMAPSWGLGEPRRRRRLLALLAVRDEMRHLPGYFANVAPHVDGVVALDDGSTDGSAEFLEGRAEVLEVIRVPADRPGWDEVGNYRRLVDAALRHEPDWLVSLDADERVERGFRGRAERVMARGERLGLSAFAVRLRELWGSENTMRVDGRWGRKAPPRLFRAGAGLVFDQRPLHAGKAPLQARFLGSYLRADLLVYHVKMINPDDREARRARYLAADPECRWQPGVGYDYLTDERGLRLRSVPRRRGFER